MQEMFRYAVEDANSLGLLKDGDTLTVRSEYCSGTVGVVLADKKGHIQPAS